MAFDVQVCISIFDAASRVLEQVCALDQIYGLHLSCSRFILTATLLSLASMARILKGPFAAYLDQARGYSLFDSGICFVRSCSVQKGDFADKCASSAERMWKSKKVFRNSDGTINITLRIRNRLSVGPWHDTLACWKEEFFDPECVHYALGTDSTLFSCPYADAMHSLTVEQKRGCHPVHLLDPTACLIGARLLKTKLWTAPPQDHSSR